MSRQLMQPRRAYFALIFVGLSTSAACGSGVRHELIDSSIAVQTEACSPPGTPANDLYLELDAGAAIARCEVTLQQCGATDQAILSSYANCLQRLPRLQCNWLSDAATSVPAEAYKTQAQTCSTLLTDGVLTGVNQLLSCAGD
jgi:hypothetical protein